MLKSKVLYLSLQLLNLTGYLRKNSYFRGQSQFISCTDCTDAYCSTDIFYYCIHQNGNSPSTSYLNHEVIFFFYFTNTANNLRIAFFNFFIGIRGDINVLTAVIIAPQQALQRWLTQGVILCTKKKLDKTPSNDKNPKQVSWFHPEYADIHF